MKSQAKRNGKKRSAWVPVISWRLDKMNAMGCALLSAIITLAFFVVYMILGLLKV
ncbi:MAG: hypothetical protein IK092_04505 [Muribaculaceae bacterium]|nr:hypothetical protein [Muribaculaceae bacterium]